MVKKHYLRIIQKSSGKEYGEKKNCNMSASWIGNMEKGNEKLNKQKWENITVLEQKAALTKFQKWKNITALELKAALTKFQKWKSLGIDKVPNFLVKCPVIVPCYVYKSTD